jgi:hypothetical protein
MLSPYNAPTPHPPASTRTLSLNLSTLCVACQFFLFWIARVGGGVELNNTTLKKRVIRPCILVPW